MMRTLICTILSLTVLFAGFSPPAHAKGGSSERARRLIARLHQHPPKMKRAFDTPLLKFLPSPQSPLQNHDLAFFIQTDNRFPGLDLSMDVEVGGVRVANLPNPTRSVFVAALGPQSKIGPATLAATLYGSDPATNTDIRSAIKALDTDISRLTNQANNERDPARRATLQEQRDEKVALKSELVAELNAFRVKLATQSYSYTVSADSNSGSQPKIVSVSPPVGSTGGGTPVTITGANFLQNPRVLFGGVAAPSATLLSPNLIQATTPVFSSTGAKDVEVQFSTGQGTVNAVSPGAFFAANFAGGTAENPVSIASGSQRVPFGSSAQLDGSLSYAMRPTRLNFNWSIVSAPIDSLYFPGEPLSSLGSLDPSQIVFQPDRGGTFVIQLVVSEAETAEHLESAPSIAVVEADASPRPTATAITVLQGRTATSQVVPNDPVQGESVYYSISLNPEHGAASVSGAGLVSYSANSAYVGPDIVKVRARSQNGLFGIVAIPVTVFDSHISPRAPGIGVVQGHSASSQITANDPIPGDVISYAITQAPSHGAAVVSSSGLVTYTAGDSYQGGDSITVGVAGQSGAEGAVVIPVTVYSPVSFTLPPLFATFLREGNPYAVQFMALQSTPIMTPNGLAALGWDFGDGTVAPAPLQTIPGFQNAAMVEHEYLAPGTYTATLTAVDKSGASANGTVTVKVLDGALPAAAFKQSTYSGSVPLTVNFDGSGSSSPAGIAAYTWFSTASGPQAGPNASFTFNSAGTYPIVLNVTDGNGISSLAIATVYAGITPPTAIAPPVAGLTISPSWEGLANVPMAFSAAGSFDPNLGGDIASYSWNFGDFAQCPNGCTGVGAQATHAYLQPQTYFPSLTVTSTLGLSSQPKYYVAQAVTSGHAPFAVANIPVQNGPVPLAVPVDGSFSYDSDGTIQSYSWNFGDYASCPDGCSASQALASHTYANPGAYVLSLRVTDDAGNTAVRIWQVLASSGFSAMKFLDSGDLPDNDPSLNAMAGACALGDGRACFELSRIYTDKGNAAAAQSFKARACSLNYQPACSFNEKRRTE